MRIPSIVEAATSVMAAWDIMQGREEGIQRVDLSKDGYRSSFGVMVYVYIILISTPASLRLFSGKSVSSLDFTFIVFVILGVTIGFAALYFAWHAYAYVLARFAKRLEIESTFRTFIIIRNWSTLLITIVSVLVSAALGWVSVFIGWLVTLWGLWVIFNAARLVARASVKSALLMIGLELLIGAALGIGLGLLSLIPVMLLASV